jgi:putative oxidoreductase
MPNMIDRLATRGQDVILLLGRSALAAIFVYSSFNKLTHWDAFTASLAGQGVPMPEVLSVAGVAVEAMGTIAVVLGFKTRFAALLLILFTVVATLIAHRFWIFDDAARAMQAIHFMKNIAIVGGFLLLCAAGPGAYSLDRRAR